MQPWWSGFAPELLGLLHEPFDSFLEKANGLAKARELRSSRGRALAFVAQEVLSNASLAAGYEAFIAQTGLVPTRDCRHDRLNTLVWLSAPLSKQRLNALHAKALTAADSLPQPVLSATPETAVRPFNETGKGRDRGVLRDALTLIDENLLVVVARTRALYLLDLLKAHDWRGLFLTNRNAWQTDWQPLVFGHALLEKLDTPFKAITAHCLVISADTACPPSKASWQSLDRLLCEHFDEGLTSRKLRVLPVMGLPGWWADNEDPNFYNDTKVFRPRRHPQGEASGPRGSNRGLG